MMLPTNRAMEEGLQQLSLVGPEQRPDWPALLHPGPSSFKLLYSLQIVDSFLRVRRGLAHPLSLCQFPEHGCVHVQTSSPDNDRSGKTRTPCGTRDACEPNADSGQF